MAIPYGIGVQWNHDILHIFVPSGIARNKVTHNSVAIKCAVVASRWAHLVGDNRPYPLVHRDPRRNLLRRMGLPPNLQRASLAPPSVSRKRARSCRVAGRKAPRSSLRRHQLWDNFSISVVGKSPYHKLPVSVFEARCTLLHPISSSHFVATLYRIPCVLGAIPNPRPSVITLKPAIRYQFKTGQLDWPKT
jgi:hypothetical protein